MNRFNFRTLQCLGVAGLLGISLLTMGCSDVLVSTIDSRNAGIKQYQDGQYAEAAGTLQTTIRHNPADYPTHYYLAASFEKLGSYEQAIEQYKTTLELMSHSQVGKDDHPFRAMAVDSLARAAVKSKDRDLRTIAITSGSEAENDFLLAKINRGWGDADAALEAYAKAARLAPDDFDIAREHGLYLVQLGQTEKARRELRRAYALNGNDDQVTVALRQVGVVPGPSLKNEDDLHKPLIPVGPLPELGQPAAPASDRARGSQPE